MGSYDELLNTIKQAAAGMLNDADLSDVCFGTVTSSSPLQVKVEQKFTIGAANLIVPQHLTSYTVQVTIDWETNQDTYTHKHNVEGTDSSDDTRTYKLGISGTKTMTINNALKSGDSVILVKQLGGQKYLIIDRVG